MWPAVLADATVQAALAARTELRQETIRLWGTPESELAATLRELGDALTDLEITTCLRDGELEIVTRFAPAAQRAYDALGMALAERYPDTLFSTGPSIDELVAARLRDRGLTIATAESCTGGLLAGRLTDLPGSSAYVLGGVVSYANEVKQDVLGVPAALIAELGAVSAEVAAAMAAGVRGVLGADIGVGITGIAGPDGGTPDKPVGLVYLCASDSGRSVARRVVIPGGRLEIRRRAVVVALHLVRQLLG
jgi:nicotinamide-nucleotide amidase